MLPSTYSTRHRLAADLALLAVTGPGRLDDVAGRRLVRIGGVAAKTGVFGLQRFDARLELQNKRLQLGHTCLKPLAVRACACIAHADAAYSNADGKSITLSGNP